jgi:[ribosomal protein S5]-alanine N-acetyltransferase
VSDRSAPPVLRTARLVLRPISLDDAPAIQRHFANWNVIRKLTKTVPWPYPPDGAARFIREVALPSIERGEALLWVLVPFEGPNEAMGLVHWRRSYAAAEGNRGFWLAEPYWGRGLMTEAVAAVQDYLFFEFGVDRLVVANAVSNAASRRVKEKTGARLLGRAQLEHHEGDDESEVWEITRDAWAALRGK